VDFGQGAHGLGHLAELGLLGGWQDQALILEARHDPLGQLAHVQV
jgi:hypothetical protein